MRRWGCKKFRGCEGREKNCQDFPPLLSLAGMRTILIIILILLLIGVFPYWGYSSGWGYYPFGGIGLVLLIVLILALMGKL